MVAMACTGAVIGSFVLTTLVVERANERLVTSSSAADDQLTLNVTHFLKMGAQARPGSYNDYYGVYFEDDITATRALRPGSQRFWGNVEVYVDRVRGMGPLGYPFFLAQKLAWFAGDGSFFMWGEGGMTANPMAWSVTDPASRTIQDWFYLEGEHYPTLYSLWQGAWLLVLALVALGPATQSRDTGRDIVTAVRLGVVMLVVFLLFFEARARYLYLYLPSVMVLASLALDDVTVSLRAWVGDRRTSPPGS